MAQCVVYLAGIEMLRMELYFFSMVVRCEHRTSTVALIKVWHELHQK